MRRLKSWLIRKIGGVPGSARLMMERAQPMRNSLRTWLIVGLLFGTMAYAIAEDITLTTYYPSPRGVYDQLIVNTLTLGNPGDLTVPGTLTVNGNTTLGDAATDLVTFNAASLAIPNTLNIGANTVFIDAASGTVGIGTSDPQEALHVVTNTFTPLRLESGVSSTSYLQARQLPASHPIFPSWWALDVAGASQGLMLQHTTGTDINLLVSGNIRSTTNIWDGASGFVLVPDGTPYEAGVVSGAASQGSTQCPDGQYVIGIEVLDGDFGKYCVRCLTGIRVRCGSL